MAKHRNVRNARKLVKSGVLNGDLLKLIKTAVFNDVSAVIGDTAARRELMRVIREYDRDILHPQFKNASLSGCFVWSGSPQGPQFWQDIYYTNAKF